MTVLLPTILARLRLSAATGTHTLCKSIFSAALHKKLQMPHQADLITLPLAGNAVISSASLEDDENLCRYCEGDGSSSWPSSPCQARCGHSCSQQSSGSPLTQRSEAAETCSSIANKLARRLWLGAAIALTLTAAGLVGMRLQLTERQTDGRQKEVMIGVVAFVVGLWLPTPAV